MTNKEVALAFMNAADSGDFSSLEKVFGPNHKFHSSMSPVPMNTEQHLAVSKAFHDGFSNGKHNVHDVMESGNKVAVRGVWSGSHTGTFNGIPASGKSVNLSFITIVEVENNEMVNQ